MKHTENKKYKYTFNVGDEKICLSMGEIKETKEGVLIKVCKYNNVDDNYAQLWVSYNGVRSHLELGRRTENGKYREEFSRE